MAYHPVGLSVRHGDIFLNLIGLPLASGDVLPVGTPFVCRSGGIRAELIFQHPIRGELSMIVMAKPRIQREMRRGVRSDLPIRLAAAFGYPLDHIPRVRPIPNNYYALAIPTTSLDGEELPVGTVVSYVPMNGLHVFTIEGRTRLGFPARLVFGDEDLRTLLPLRKSCRSFCDREVA